MEAEKLWMEYDEKEWGVWKTACMTSRSAYKSQLKKRILQRIEIESHKIVIAGLRDALALIDQVEPPKV
jgi:hypothetical protein